MSFYNVLVGFFWFLCGFAIVNRICSCFEQCAMAKAFPEWSKNQLKKPKETDIKVEEA